ncbi:hypothetical protein [Streptomyces coelicoflavus]|uniref:hypothetical protein n=1 Tax=Streptomyces coelicoflavus TaxID=285562 RepID=UPI002E274D3B
MTTTGTPTTGGPTTATSVGTTIGTSTDAAAEPRYAWFRRGRHRRPRPRKVLLVAGGLALAAGALSLVRLLPEPGGDAAGGFGAEAAPRVDGGGGDTGGGDSATDDRATASAAAGTGGGGPPGAGPSATSAMGGLSGSPGPGLIPGLVPGPSASGPPVPLPTTTGNPGDPGDPDASDGRRPGETHEGGSEGGREDDADDRARDPAPGTPQPSRSETPATPTPPPARSTPPTSAPAPEPDDPGLCVPIIGLCVDLLGG